MFMYGVAAGASIVETQDQIRENARARQKAISVQTEIKELAGQVDRLTLLNQAMWELLREKLGLTDADLERMAEAVDMRDGVADGKMTATAVRCPACNRVCNSRHAKCLYCGQAFEKPVFG